MRSADIIDWRSCSVPHRSRSLTVLVLMLNDASAGSTLRRDEDVDSRAGGCKGTAIGVLVERLWLWLKYVYVCVRVSVVFVMSVVIVSARLRRSVVAVNRVFVRPRLVAVSAIE